MKDWFNKYTIEDLTTWLNQENYRTELKDWDALEIENFDFEWNELISSKSIELKYTWWWKIQWIFEDENWEIYHLEDWNLYKDWVILFPWDEKEVTFSAIDWKPLSITIDGVSKVYKFGYHNNEGLALDDLLNALQADFTDYTITRIGSVFTISSLTENVIVSNSNLIKKIEISNWNTYSKLDITIDWTTYTWLWSNYSSSNDFLSYIVTQLSSSYKTSTPSSWIMYIWKEHSAITISFTEYDRYKYAINYRETDTPSNWQYADYTDTIINWTAYRFDYISDSRGFKWSNTIRDLAWWNVFVEAYWSSIDTISSTAFRWVRITSRARQHLTKVTKYAWTTATRAVLKDTSWTILATANFSWNDATFDYWLAWQTDYDIWVDSNWASFTYVYIWNTSGWPKYWETTTWNTTIWVAAISSIDVEPQMDTTWYIISAEFNYSWWTDTVWNSSRTYYWYTHTLNIAKTDYTPITFASNSHYTYPWSFPDDTYWYSLTTNNYHASWWYSTSSQVTFNIVNNSLWIEDYFYHIDKNPYWFILTPKQQAWQPSNIIYITDAWVPHLIDAKTLVWDFYCSIYYNNKLILWWDKWILYYSKTVSTAHPEYLYNFTTYSAWFQPVGWAWWIKWLKSSDKWLYIFKEKEVYRTTWINDFEKKDEATWSLTWAWNFIIDKISSSWVKRQEHIKQINQEIFYYDNYNRVIRRIWIEENITDLRDRNISNKIKETLLNIPVNWNGDDYYWFIHLTYKYPYLMVFVTDESSIAAEPYKYWKIPSKCLKYNVEKENWTTEDLYTSKWLHFPYISYNNIVVWIDNKIYKYNNLFDETTDWFFLSWDLTLNSDIEYKKLWGFYFSWVITWDKTIEIELLRDWTNMNIWTIPNLTKRIITWPASIREKIDLYECWIQSPQFKISYTNWDWYIKISEVGFLWKEDKSYNNYY